MICAHDPGHGCPPCETGVVARGICERDLVLKIAFEISQGIPWCQHLLLRDSPIGYGYQERAGAAKKGGAQLVLCHHVNAGSDRGLMTFYDPEDHFGWTVAAAIARAAPARLYRTNAVHTVNPEDWTSRAYNVLAPYRKTGLPAVLIEWGFATSAIDSVVLTSAVALPAIVTCASAGIARAMEVLHIFEGETHV